MIWVVIGCSSPFAGAAVFRDSELLSAGGRVAPGRASGTALDELMNALEPAGIELGDVELFAADAGPGSFTGIKIGVTLAKTLAYAHKRPAAGISAFDLISNEGPAAVPAPKGQYLLRVRPGDRPELVGKEDPRLRSAAGYGAAFEQPVFPLPERAGALFEKLKPADPESLVPDYVLEPSITKPKRPFRGMPE
ncbi:MAG: tRNA (adenosine(37)-N6)-threonylcarbamoyltransferase complex dimerization subunit type 1 TsaB [Armatimonadetes bacterium]|nr:tRNA (adenosine(37)-N6)-threonylcarbamoyltransferase complex dimerization subunit type 1 TsaB [Armatimonadota bacterium]